MLNDNLGFDLGAISKIQEMSSKTFEGITPAAMKGISESLSRVAKVSSETFEIQKNVQEISSVPEGLPRINYDNIAKSLKGITQMMPALSDTLAFNASTYLKNVPIESIANSFKGIQNIFGNNIEEWVSMFESIKVWNEQVLSVLDRIPYEEYEILLKDTEYTKDDVIGDFNNISTEIKEEDNDFQQIFSDNTLNPKEKIAKLKNVIYTKYHAVFYVALIIGILIDIHTGKEALQNTYIPFFESIIVAIEGNQNKYFIKEEKVKVYESSSCRSKVLDMVYYGEEVEEVKDVKMWLEVSYINEDGTECIGWIAKRNLMTYKDWKYNCDDLYNIE